MKTLCLLFCLAAVGCATVTRGVDEVYYVDSEPPGAEVMLTWDEPAVLFVEESKSSSFKEAEFDGQGGGGDSKETVIFSRLNGTTPATFKIPRKGSFTVTISKEGYKKVTTRVQTQMSTAGGAGLAGNLCLGGCIGGLVDSTSGATLEHIPPFVKVKLEKEDLNPTFEPPSGRGSELNQER